MKGGRVVKLTPSPSKSYSQKASFIRVKTYLGKEKVFNFISSMIEESKHFNKGLVMTKEGKEDFKNSTKCWICDNDCVDNDVKIRDHCHIAGNIAGKY